MKLEINKKWELLVKKSIEKIETFNVSSKRKKLKNSIESKTEVITSLQAEIKEEQAILDWITKNVKEELEEDFSK